MLVADKHRIEQVAVGIMLASAQDDLDGVVALVDPLTREELIGSLAYCARFAVSYARRSTGTDGEVSEALRWYAATLAVRA